MFNLFKMAKYAQSAFNVIDNVNNTYNIPHDNDAPLSVYAHDVNKDGGERAMSMVRATVNQDYFDLVKLGFDELIRLVSKDPLPFEHYLEAISQYTDTKILQIAQEEQLRFVGGECLITVIREEKKVKNNIKLYFKDAEGQWKLNELNGTTYFHSFTAETLDNEITAIMEEGGKKFPILAPKVDQSENAT